MNKPIRRLRLQEHSPQDAGAAMSRRKAYGGPAAGRGAAEAVTPKTSAPAEQPAAKTHALPTPSPQDAGAAIKSSGSGGPRVATLASCATNFR